MTSATSSWRGARWTPHPLTNTHGRFAPSLPAACRRERFPLSFLCVARGFATQRRSAGHSETSSRVGGRSGAEATATGQGVHRRRCPGPSRCAPGRAPPEPGTEPRAGGGATQAPQHRRGPRGWHPDRHPPRPTATLGAHTRDRTLPWMHPPGPRTRRGRARPRPHPPGLGTHRSAPPRGAPAGARARPGPRPRGPAPPRPAPTRGAAVGAVRVPRPPQQLQEGPARLLGHGSDVARPRCRSRGGGGECPPRCARIPRRPPAEAAAPAPSWEASARAPVPHSCHPARRPPPLLSPPRLLSVRARGLGRTARSGQRSPRAAPSGAGGREGWRLPPELARRPQPGRPRNLPREVSPPPTPIQVQHPPCSARCHQPRWWGAWASPTTAGLGGAVPAVTRGRDARGRPLRSLPRSTMWHTANPC